MSDEKPKLSFHNLAERHRGITPAVGESYAEAARVCLDRHHASPVDFNVDNAGTTNVTVVEWIPTNEKIKDAWANEIDTTEAGAYACALAAVELTNGMVAMRRAETRTGADYYIAPPNVDLEDLENCYRLEVSGVDKGAASIIHQRLRAKLEQAKAGSSNLPAIASVVGFRERLVLLQQLISDKK
ncbi:MAG TPA: hypothetical protein VLX29_05020 [Nitrospirota bacterium]|nr:hypothetical protein [Nitrospirota bacterium]